MIVILSEAKDPLVTDEKSRSFASLRMTPGRKAQDDTGEKGSG
jgi:hypothetical protein